MKLKLRLFLAFALSVVTSYGQLAVKIDASKTSMCSNDTIELSAFAHVGTPTIYAWTVANGTLDNSTSKVVRFTHKVTNTINIWVYLEATDGNDFSYDSIKITVMPLPAVLVKDMAYCQTDSEILLNQLVIAPTNPISGIYSWICNSCNTIDENKLIWFKKNGFYKQYYLNFRDSVVDLGQNDSQLLSLIYTYTSDNGCSNFDTSYITIKACRPGLSGTIENNNLKVSPNPFNSHLQISNNNNHQLSLDIFDSFGKRVYSGDLLNYNTNLDLSMLKSGTYYLTFSSLSGQQAHYKVIKI